MDEGIYRLHTLACIEHYARSNRTGKDCRCMIHFEGKIGPDFIRQSIKTRTWSKAVARVKQARDRGYWVKPQKEAKNSASLTLEQMRSIYLESLESRKGKAILRTSLTNHKTMINRFVQFCDKRGYTDLNEISLAVLEDFKDTWPMHSIQAIRLAVRRLKAFYKFSLKRGWVKQNTAEDMEAPEEEHIERMPFTPEEESRLVESASGDDQTIMLLMRYSGMAVCDAALLQASELRGDEIRYFRKKTRRNARRVSVVVPIPGWLVERLKATPLKQGRYFFCAGSDRVESAAKYWLYRLSPVFKKAGLERAETHRFRHTFATSLLTEGYSLEDVSKWLGHASVKTTERYYSHWTEGRIKSASDRLRQRYACRPVEQQSGVSEHSYTAS